MGYYTGNGVVTQKAGDGQFLEREVVPSVIVDGKPVGWNTNFYTQTSFTSVTTKNGVEMPADSDLTPTISYYNNGMIATKTTKQAQRIGETNLWTLISTSLVNTVYRNGTPLPVPT